MFQKHDLNRNKCMLTGSLRRKGYDWWWHSFTGIHEETGEERAFFIEFFVCNPSLGGSMPIYGQLPENQKRGKRPSYLMVKAGTWGSEKCQLHRFFAWDDVQLQGKTPFSISAFDCEIDECHTKGHIELSEETSRNHPEYMCDAGSIEWDLSIEKQIAFNVGYGASGFFRAIKAFEMYWHAEGMKTLYSGSVTVNGVRYRVDPDSCYGYADKNWGKNFTSPWVWLSSNHIISRISGKQLHNTVFDIGGGCPKVYFVPLKRKLLGAMWYEGQPFEFNFSKFWTGSRTRFSSTETEDEILWDVEQETRSSVMKTKVRCKKAEMLLVNYESPDGRKRHNRLWNGGTGSGEIQLYAKKHGELVLIDDLVVSHIGCEYGEYTE